MRDHHVLTEGSLPPSGVSSTAFPSFPAPAGALTLALLAQLAETQWWPVERLRTHQLDQLGRVVRHAARHTAYGRQHFPELGEEPLTWERWTELPILARRVVQAEKSTLISDVLPDGHAPAPAARSSGSTGTPVVVERTRVAGVMWDVLTARDTLWHRRDTSLGFATVRHAPGAAYPHGSSGPSWGPSATVIGPPGPAHLLHIGATTAEQLEWLQRRAFAYLLLYPSGLRDLVRLTRSRGVRFPGLRSARTFGEVVSPGLRAEVHEAWGVPIEDVYSAQEVGYIALQCPDHDHFHVQSEAVCLEVVRDDGSPCEVGEVGRIVVTALHNLAMPLVRYDLGDRGVLGPPCPCGRGLPVLERVLGRVHETFVTAQGDRIWLTVGVHRLPEVAPVVQHQLVQRAVGALEVRLVGSRAATASETTAVRDLLVAALPPGTAVTVVWVEAIPRTAGGKFLDFVSEL